MPQGGSWLWRVICRLTVIPWLAMAGTGVETAAADFQPAQPTQLAQAIPGLPPRPEETDRPRLAPRSVPDTTPPPRAIPAQPPAARPGELTVTIADVQIEGVSVYDPAELRPLYAALLNRPVPISAIAELEAAISSRYRADGYVLARAIVPAGQSLDPAAAVIRVVVYEGYIDRIIFQDVGYEDGSHGRLVRDMLERIKTTCPPRRNPDASPHCPLHKDVLERYLLLAGDLPGVDLNVIVQPSTTDQGAASLFVTVTERLFEGNTRLDNRGSRFVGPWRWEGSLGLTNATGFYERTRLRYQTTPFNQWESLQLFDLAEEIPLGSDGTRLAIAASRVHSRPTGSLRQIDFQSSNTSLVSVLSHPLIRSRSENLNIRFLMGGRNAEGELPTGLSSYDATRYFGFGATYDLSDGWFGITLVDVEFQQGLKTLGAARSSSTSRPFSRLDGRPDFKLVTAQVQRLQRIASRWNLLVSARGQYALTNLLASQEFAIGGEQFGRAFDSGEAVGDHGFGLSAELQWLLHSNATTGDTVQLYGFGDYGRVWNRSGALLEFNPTLGASTVDMASAGSGVRFVSELGITGYAEVALPLTERRSINTSGHQPRLFVALSFRF